jgi:hypothetical protein
MLDPKSPVFQRKADSSQNAFTVLAPQDWQMAGGMQRFNPNTDRLSAQNVEAKIDFAVKSDAAGTVMMRWCPEIKYCDGRWWNGMLAPGSNYNGMPVYPIVPAVQFLTQIMFAWAHPQAQGAQLLEQKPVPEALERYQNFALQNGLSFQYDAAEVIYSYTEGGVQYKEQAATVIENMGQAGMGMWSNKGSLYLRAPAAEYDTWLPVLNAIAHSFRFNMAWLEEEHQVQAVLSRSMMEAHQAERYRAQQARETRDYIHQVQTEIREHRSQTQAEIRHDEYLALRGQDEYVNPIGGEIDQDSNEWSHRWVTPGGDVYFSNNEDDNPNNIVGGGVLDRTDWQRTPARPR